MKQTGLKSFFLKSRVLKHILFWVVYIFLNTMMYGQAGGDYYIQFKLQLFYLPAVLGATYLTLYVLLPHFLLAKKYFLFSGLFVLMALVFSLAQRANIYFFVIPEFYPKYVGQYKFWSVDIIFRIFSEFPVVIFAALIKLLSSWYQNEQRNQQLAQEKLQAELKFLKAQIHPHFLFNTLNNLYALTLKKSDLAPEMVLKLSDLLNYMMYESNVETIALSKEIEVLENYIELEKIRYGEHLDVTFEISGEIENKRIAPLLLLPFIENSYKHGVSKKIEDKWIKIHLTVDDSILTLRVLNSMGNSSIHDPSDYAEGIGLKNVQRRLDLLYPQKHQLNINGNGKEFSVTLEVNMSNLPTEIDDEN